MTITFDPAKRDGTRRDRGLDFLDAAEVFAGRKFEFPDKRFDYGEVRNVTVGYLRDRMMLVVWGPNAEKRATSFQ